MNINFDNKVALITGAAGGIGFCAAKMFAQSGAKVMLTDINEELLIESTQKLKAEGFDVSYKKCDVSVEDEVKSLVDETVNVFGRLDFAYNNVGIHAKVREKLAQTEREDFDHVMAVNLGGIWNCMKYEIIAMQKHNEGGAIVNCSSQGGVVGIADISAYCTSKHAIIGLTKSAALEYAKEGIRINVICPGTCETPMVENAIKQSPIHMAKVIEAIPLGRIAKAEEIVSMVIFLCSDYGGSAIGQVISIDGGYTAI